MRRWRRGRPRPGPFRCGTGSRSSQLPPVPTTHSYPTSRDKKGSRPRRRRAIRAGPGRILPTDARTCALRNVLLRHARMFKRHNQVFTALRVALDMLLVAASFWGAYALRFGSPKTWPYPALPLPEETLIVGLLAVIVWPLS